MPAEIRIINLPTRTPILSSDFFVFEKEITPGVYVTSKAKISAYFDAADNTFATVQYVDAKFITELANRSNWDSTYNTVAELSASWTNTSDVVLLSANIWNNTYNSFTTFQTVSTNYVTETVAIAYAVAL